MLKNGLVCKASTTWTENTGGLIVLRLAGGVINIGGQFECSFPA